MRFVLFISFIIFMLLGSAQNNDWTTKFESSNFLETTTYDECISFCRKLDEISNLISYLEIGESPQGRSIPMLIVDKDGLTNAQDIRKKGRIILFIQAGIHAGEPDGTDAGFLILRDMVAYNKGINLLENVSILFIPSFNVDGLARMSPYNRINQNGPIEMGWRTNSLNLNLNRDYMKADSPEIRAWLKIFHEYLPDFFIDCHTTDGADYQYIATYSLETFGNMDADLTKWTKDVYETYLQSEMEKNETPIFPYVSFKNWHDPRSGLIRKVGTPMISQGYTALQNRVGLLVETHMLKPYKPRVLATKNILIATLKILNKEVQNLMELNHNADVLMSNKRYGLEKLAVKYDVDYQDTSYTDFLGVEYEVVKSDLTGGDWFQYSDKKTTFNLELFEKQKAEVVVDLPLAYIIPVEYQEVQEVIKAHGIEFISTRSAREVNIDTYKFSNQKWRPYSYEGRQILSEFEMEAIQKKVLFEKGAMIVPVHQRSLKVLVYLLEPKADNSLVGWGFFNASMERKEYVETYVMEKMAREMIAEDPNLLEEFEAWKKENPEAGKNQLAQTMWFFERTPYWDQKKDIYPVGKIYDNQTLFELGMH